MYNSALNVTVDPEHLWGAILQTASVVAMAQDGISHNEEEFSSREQCAAGAQVLLNAVLEFDRQLASRGG